ncbi:MAG TPA: hypothetical protein VFV87_20935 [Pirellulaceae bacterium]|nr:hypothetical protein [Pirellulaceae bacterium]
MGFRAALLAVVVAGSPAVATAQYQQYATPRSPSVVQPAGVWHNYAVVPDGHCGCAMPVRCDNYTPCCSVCNFHPVCLLKNVGRMLDCLLPCGRCCHGGCGIGCGVPCCRGGYGGGYPMGCPSCSTPALSDPFRDDPEPLTPPAPVPAAEVRRHSSSDSPYNVIRDPRPDAQASTDFAPERGQSQPRGTSRRSPIVTTKPAARKPSEQSILRRASLEEETTQIAEPATLEVEAAEARPIQRAAASSDDYWSNVPRNPLR